MTAKPMQSHSLCIAIADKLRERILATACRPARTPTMVRWRGSLA